MPLVNPVNADCTPHISRPHTESDLRRCANFSFNSRLYRYRSFVSPCGDLHIVFVCVVCLFHVFICAVAIYRSNRSVSCATLVY
ncbi:hypothetical protein BDR04DRAFT_272214 [Suillus decipiens]|nr:hypothetical protein BDR04DRAFT_272214 [Suillus decipiens]